MRTWIDEEGFRHCNLSNVPVNEVKMLDLVESTAELQEEIFQLIIKATTPMNFKSIKALSAKGAANVLQVYHCNNESMNLTTHQIEYNLEPTTTISYIVRRCLLRLKSKGDITRTSKNGWAKPNKEEIVKSVMKELHVLERMGRISEEIEPRDFTQIVRRLSNVTNEQSITIKEWIIEEGFAFENEGKLRWFNIIAMEEYEKLQSASKEKRSNGTKIHHDEAQKEIQSRVALQLIGM